MIYFKTYPGISRKDAELMLQPLNILIPRIYQSHVYDNIRNDMYCKRLNSSITPGIYNFCLVVFVLA
jgi:hypothetical protein